MSAQRANGVGKSPPQATGAGSSVASGPSLESGSSANPPFRSGSAPKPRPRSTSAVGPPLKSAPAASPRGKPGSGREPRSPTAVLPPSGSCGPAADGCLGDLFALLSQAHMMQILGLLIWRSSGPVRFVELQEALGISPNTLSVRLKALLDAGLVTRTAYSTIPPRVDYEATPKAHGLKRVFKALQEWASQNTLGATP